MHSDPQVVSLSLLVCACLFEVFTPTAATVSNLTKFCVERVIEPKTFIGDCAEGNCLSAFDGNASTFYQGSILQVATEVCAATSTRQTILGIGEGRIPPPPPESSTSQGHTHMHTRTRTNAHAHAHTSTLTRARPQEEEVLFGRRLRLEVFNPNGSFVGIDTGDDGPVLSPLHARARPGLSPLHGGPGPVLSPLHARARPGPSPSHTELYTTGPVRPRCTQGVWAGGAVWG